MDKSNDPSLSRKGFLAQVATWGVAMVASPMLAVGQAQAKKSARPKVAALKRPNGPIQVAFLISEGFQMIDFAGPWEIFQDAADPVTGDPAFSLFTVSRDGKPVKSSGGLSVTPSHTFATAPQPHVIVIPAQSDDREEVMEWLRKASERADMTMSVCTGAFLLAKSGLLDGKMATTHHSAYKYMAATHPRVKIQRNVRFVDLGKVATSSGLSAGIDLALHVVARYLGDSAADKTAAEIEYVGYGWKEPTDTGDLVKRWALARKGPICPVCEMGPVGKEISYKFQGKTFYFCSDGCRTMFMKSPGKFLAPTP